MLQHQPLSERQGSLKNRSYGELYLDVDAMTSYRSTTLLYNQLYNLQPDDVTVFWSPIIECERQCRC